MNRKEERQLLYKGRIYVLISLVGLLCICPKLIG